MICQGVGGFFCGGELIGFGFNRSLGVDGLVHTFTHCDYQTACGDMFVEHINHHLVINCSLVTTSREASLDCSIAILFSFLPCTNCGFGESRGVFFSNRRNQ
jgi:hypothetical protein